MKYSDTLCAFHVTNWPSSSSSVLIEKTTLFERYEKNFSHVTKSGDFYCSRVSIALPDNFIQKINISNKNSNEKSTVLVVDKIKFNEFPLFLIS